MTKLDEQVCFSKNDVIAILRDMDMIVVSLDKIGSCVEQSPGERDKLLVDFMDEWDILTKLAAIRGSLSAPFSTELGDDDMQELERELQDTKYWTYFDRKP